MRLRSGLVAATLAAGLLLVAVFSGTGAVWARSSVPDCAAQSCPGGAVPSAHPTSTPASRNTASCVRDASCGGGGALSLGVVAGLLLAAIVAATGIIRSAPRFLRRVRDAHTELARGVGWSLLRPPQSV
jgi:hypothetical protein